MKDEKDLQGQDPEALELQIEQMIDELFVSKEEPVSADEQAAVLGTTTPGAEVAPGMASGGEDFGAAAVGSAAVNASELSDQPVSGVATAADVGAQADKTGMELQWDISPPGADSSARGGEQEVMASGMAAVDELARRSHAETVQFEEAGAETRFAAVSGGPEETVPLSKSPDDVAQRAYNSLKENMLSLEWEISPQTIERFLEAIKPAQAYLSGNASAMKAVSMMVSVLQYIRRVGRSAQPLSIQVMQNGVDFLGFELLPEEHANGEKRKELLATFVDHYRVLKFQIEQQRDKTQRPGAKAPALRPSVSPEIAEYVKSVVDEAVRGMLETTIEPEMQKLKQEIMDMLSQHRSAEASVAPSPLASPVSEPTTAPPETVSEEVLTVTLGDRYFNIPKALVANVYAPSPRKLAKVLDNRSFRITDLLSLFASATKGLMGPLCMVPLQELKSRSFDLVDAEKAFGVPGYLQPRQLILISDGNKGFGLLADASIWRVVEIPKGMKERMVTGVESSGDVLSAPPEEYPFLNVSKML